MTDFIQELRHYCRNPRCRSKLKAPLANLREAFCTRGCHNSFYLHRCLVCEQPMERRSEHQLVCGNRRCRNALRARFDGGRYHAPSAGITPSKKPANIDPKLAPVGDRAWRIVAGPELSASVFHCATVGAEEAVAKAKVEERTLIKRHDPPVNVLGGYKFPSAPAVNPRPSKPPATIAALPVRAGAADIPEFLNRKTKAAALDEGGAA